MLHLRAPRARPRLVTAMALALVAASIAGCGGGSSGGRLSRASASDLRATLDQVQQDVSERNCTGATEQVAVLEQQIDDLRRVDKSLRSALRGSARRLSTLVENQCQTTTVPTQTQTTPPPPPAEPPGQQKKDKKAKPGKGPKAPPTDTTPTTPGTGDQSPTTPDTGGGAGIPGESNQGQ
jgi:hypothetical protein